MARSTISHCTTYQTHEVSGLPLEATARGRERTTYRLVSLSYNNARLERKT